MSQRSFRVCLALLGLSWASAPACLADIRCESWVARLVSVEGRVEAKRAGDVRWQQVLSNEIFCPGDSVRVEAHSRAAVLLRKETMLRLDQGTAVTFPATPAPTPSWLELLKGAVHFISRQPGSLQIKTPFVNAAIEGTEFVLGVGLDQTDLWVLEGRVRASNEAGSLLVASGEAAVAKAGEAPKRRTLIRPRDAVQWALYYPPLIDYRAAAYRVGPAAKAMQEALERYRRGDLPDAIARLGEVASDQRDASYFTLRAGLFLSVGRVDEARSDIAQALSTDARNGTAMALKSVIALARNEKQSALDLARQAVELEPGSPVPRIALSYAQQAHFDIDKAIESAQEAVNLAPEDALAWARLAELRLSAGDLDRSLDAARKAAALDPDLARTQTVLGFAYLTQIRIGEAKSAFEKAVVLDQADPLPRLGLGLAKIREGELEAGRQDIEIASSLDPNNSLIRSYMGKAYFDEKRGPLTASQLDIAKDLDPLDPTPWFYDAIRKQSENRPVEALHDLKKSIALNGNRAIYRSRLSLDQDLAARSAGLARIYRDLGFGELALVEGWKSVNADPGNHSAHRFLADSYAGLPRHEIARVSELLQSQLLQPLSLTPVQPQLAESNLLITEGAGPANASFNEFNPLFVRNRLALQASAAFGSNDVRGGELVHSGVLGRFSYSLGKFHYQGDGFRPNNDLEQDVSNAFVQVALTPTFGLQAEYRHRDTRHGDLSFNLPPATFDPNYRKTARSDTFRLGFDLKPAPGSDIIASIIHVNAKDEQTFDFGSGPIPPSVDIREGDIAEMQYLWRSPAFALIAGGGHYDVSLNDMITRNSNAYLYSYFRYPAFLTWTVGLSVDYLDDAFLGELDRVNPKLGLLFNFDSGATLRLSAFKVAKRTLIADQTIEPTQIAGFNQFFDDFNGTESRRYGIAVDQPLASNAYAGLEFSRRTLEVPIAIAAAAIIVEDWTEDLYRAYLNWTPHPRWAISAAYEREHFARTALDLGLQTPLSTRTQRLPVALRYFAPSGFFASVGLTYVAQKAELVGNDKRQNRFTLVDAGLGYRLPRRRGLVSVEVRNLFDKAFQFQGWDLRTSDQKPMLFLPERTFVVGLTLVF